MTKWKHNMAFIIWNIDFVILFPSSDLIFALHIEFLMQNSPPPIDRSVQKVHSEFSPGLERNKSMKWPWIQRCRRTEYWKKHEKRNLQNFQNFELQKRIKFYLMKRWFMSFYSSWKTAFCPEFSRKTREIYFLSFADRRFLSRAGVSLGRGKFTEKKNNLRVDGKATSILKQKEASKAFSWEKACKQTHLAEEELFSVEAKLSLIHFFFLHCLQSPSVWDTRAMISFAWDSNWSTTCD